MKVIEGHLTATERKVIQYMLEKKISEGKAGNKNYFISQNGKEYTVKIQQKDRGLIPVPGSKIRLSTYTHKFVL